MEEHGVKIRYVQPQVTTHFMKRYGNLRKKSLADSSSTQALNAASTEQVASPRETIKEASVGAKAGDESALMDAMQNSAIMSGIT